MNFFNELKASISLGYLENPVPHRYAREGFKSLRTGEWVQGIGRPTQYIQPYDFGENASKKTGLWLIGLPKLKPTKRFVGRKVEIRGRTYERFENQTDSGQNKLPPSEDRWKLRAATYPKIAQAMCEQWGPIIADARKQ